MSINNSETEITNPNENIKEILTLYSSEYLTMKNQMTSNELMVIRNLKKHNALLLEFIEFNIQHDPIKPKEILIYISKKFEKCRYIIKQGEFGYTIRRQSKLLWWFSDDDSSWNSAIESNNIDVQLEIRSGLIDLIQKHFIDFSYRLVEKIKQLKSILSEFTTVFSNQLKEEELKKVEPKK